MLKETEVKYMQVVLGSIPSSLSSSASSSTSLPSTAGGFSSLLGSVQQTSENIAAANQATQAVSADFPALLASLFKPVDSVGELVDGKPELVAMIEELLEKREMPSIQDLAVLLQVDVEALQDSLRKLAQLFSGQGELTGSLEELTALVEGITDNRSLSFNESDKQLMATVMKTAQLVSYFGEHLSKQETRFQTLQAAMKNGAALLEQQMANSPQSSVKQVSLQTAFANYSSAPELEEGDPSTVKPSGQLAGTVHPFLHQLSKTEQFVMSVKTNPKPMNMEQFIEKFTQILGNANMMKTPNGTKMLIKLYPEQLGSLRIELLQQNGVMTAKILSSTQAVKELLEQNAHQLKHAFNQQNVTVDKIDVSSAETRQQLFDKGQQQREQEQKQSDEQQAGQHSDEQQTLFAEALLNVELEV